MGLTRAACRTEICPSIDRIADPRSHNLERSTNTNLMSASDIPNDVRCRDLFHHIDMGFLNRRLCITVLPAEVRRYFIERQKPGSDHMTVLGNDHFLVTLLLDACEVWETPSLLAALDLARPQLLFRSTERLAPCPEIYDALRVRHAVELDLDFGKPVYIAYHTSHLVSSTGKMVLEQGAAEGYVNSIVGVLHNHADRLKSSHLLSEHRGSTIPETPTRHKI